MGKWVILHDNGVPGQKGFSDDYTEEECKKEVERMKEMGIVVYDFWRYE